MVSRKTPPGEAEADYAPDMDEDAEGGDDGATAKAARLEQELEKAQAQLAREREQYQAELAAARAGQAPAGNAVRVSSAQGRQRFA